MQATQRLLVSKIWINSNPSIVFQDAHRVHGRLLLGYIRVPETSRCRLFAMLLSACSGAAGTTSRLPQAHSLPQLDPCPAVHPSIVIIFVLLSFWRESIAPDTIPCSRSSTTCMTIGKHCGLCLLFQGLFFSIHLATKSQRLDEDEGLAQGQDAHSQQC